MTTLNGRKTSLVDHDMTFKVGVTYFFAGVDSENSIRFSTERKRFNVQCNVAILNRMVFFEFYLFKIAIEYINLMVLPSFTK